MIPYTTTRKVLSTIVKNPKVKDALARVGKKGSEISPVEFLSILEEAETDIEVIETLTGKTIENVYTLEGVEAITNFFCTIKKSWLKLSPLLANSISQDQGEETRSTR